MMTATAERRVPFVLQVATSWTSIDDLPAEGDGELRYFPHAPLTGNISTTADGRDITFSDMEVQ